MHSRGPSPLSVDDDHNHSSSWGPGTGTTGRTRGWYGRLGAWLDQRLPWARGYERLDSAADPTDAGPSRWCPEEEASWAGRLLFTYVNSLVAKGRHKALEPEDLWSTAHRDEAARVAGAFQEQLQRTQDPAAAPQGSVWKAILRCHGAKFAAAGLVKLLHDLVQFAQPALLEALMHALTASSSNSSSSDGDSQGGWDGLLHGRSKAAVLACAMLVAAVLQALSINVFFHALFRISLHLKTQLVQLLYDKSLQLSGSARSALGVGAIVNLQSNDASKIWSLPTYGHVLWNGPFQILVIMGMLVRLLTWLPALAGLLVTLAVIPVTAVLSQRMEAWRERLLVRTDARVKLVTEAVTGIKALKLYAWEGPYQQRIHAAREEELHMVYTTQLLLQLSSAMYTAGPVVVSLAAFSTYALLGHPLTAAVAFPSLALFNLLQFPIVMIPDQIMNLIAARVGLKRIQEFLSAESMQPNAVLGALPAALAAPSGSSGSSTSHTTGVVSRSGAAATGGLTGGNGVHNPKDTSESVLHQAAAEGVDGTAGCPPAISVTNGTFCWGDEQPVLRDVTLHIPSGALVMVVGPVGSGKSSLLSALLGEMTGARGSGAAVEVRGAVAYTAQDPWIQNCSLRDNILSMGAPWNPDMYATTLTACALLPDLATLPAGDLSEIGEKGVNLSGGQKHRVALARAVYADADVYLLDDPLSAVDAHVGSVLFDRCICGVLGSKARVLVTHQLQYLPRCNMILVVEGGRITHQGTYAELMLQGVDLTKYSVPTHADPEAAESSGDSARCQPQQSQGTQGHQDAAGRAAEASTVQQASIPASAHKVNSDAQTRLPAADASSDTSDEDILVFSQDKGSSSQVVKQRSSGRIRSSHSGPDPEEEQQLLQQVLSHKEADGKLVKVEERAVGHVTWGVYYAYLSAWGPKLLLPMVLILASFLERGLQVLQNFVLSQWSNHTHEQGGPPLPASTTRWYLSMYFALGVVFVTVQFLNTWLLVVGTVAAARRLHEQLLVKVLRLPMSFFDSQPTGRLVNRFTKDAEAVDVQLSETVSFTSFCAVDALCSLAVVLAVSPLTALAFVPVAYIYYRVQGAYVSTNRELKRLDALAFSPIFQSFGETLAGLATIRAFGKQQQFREANLALLDISNRAWWPIQVVNRWLSIRLELLGAAIVFLAALAVAVLLPVDAGLAGFALTSALNLTGTMNWLVRQLTELEVNMNAVERLVQYQHQPEEAPAEVAPGPPPGWPSQGAISARQLVVSYRTDLPPVLHGISFEVAGRQKVGICGRTGCGKSTLMMTLFRIVEPADGAICIDGIDITSMGLHQLRSRLSLVPQDPVVFSGSIRSNLDPFGQAGGDAELWAALRRAGVDGAVRGMGAGLDSHVQEGGSNLSTGQRQLLCMARALLRNSRILVLDEATSHVDHATDALIHKTLKEAFGSSTVLTIAHRLHTIADVDLVLVLEAGRLLEQGAPAELLEVPGGAYRSLVERSRAARAHHDHI